jgi:hypothetical protein
LLFLRNILLNWMIFLPAFLAIALFPIAFAAALAEKQALLAPRYQKASGGCS